ncbi:hypothetical protein FACS1894116_02930 [Betaproteobacteria bacterium]|nr:hypothetical protein FACS1894116_02930 [Betaproteobacteria bacterium]GHU25676.1 hypothetical protein FACS189488_13170 [Betaproteobacteria bacterium]GHU28143.1 hypothetical protein FACS189497_02860 [Betaproteobacteria bacterium]
MKHARPLTFNHNPLLQRELPRWRTRAVLFALLAGMVVLVGGSIHLQVIPHEKLQEEGASLYVKVQKESEKGYARVLNVSAARGQITDRNGEILAASADVRDIWVDLKTVRKAVSKLDKLEPEQLLQLPEQLRQLVQLPEPETARKAVSKLEPEQLKQLSEQLLQLSGQLRQLAQLLGMSVSDVSNSLALYKDAISLKRQLAPEIAEQVIALKFPGIYQRPEFKRFYPLGDVTAHMVGLTDIEGRGQEGIEKAYDKLLTGQAGERRVVIGPNGRVVDEDMQRARPPRNGQDIVLALDSRIQYLAYNALNEAMRQYRAKAGSVVVIDVRTGEVLALVNAPTFNPNNRTNFVFDKQRNRTLIDAFEPGSIMKPFTVAMALESGRFKPTTQIDTSPGRMSIGGREITDSKPHGVLSVAEVIQLSSNIGSAKIGLQFSAEEMWKFYSSLGFGAPLGLAFPGEASGKLRPVKGLRQSEQASMSYGYSISVTLIQVARGYLAFAREGELLPLSLTKVDTPPTPVRVFSARTARELGKMLEMVVAPGGTGTRAQVAGYRVAGKTGTAYKAGKGGGYFTIENGKKVRKYISSFVGYAPASKPRLIVAVMIDEPSSESHSGGAVAAPVFAKIVESSLRTLGVEFDAPTAPMQLSALSPEQRDATHPWTGGGNARQ